MIVLGPFGSAQYFSHFGYWKVLALSLKLLVHHQSRLLPCFLVHFASVWWGRRWLHTKQAIKKGKCGKPDRERI